MKKTIIMQPVVTTLAFIAASSPAHADLLTLTCCKGFDLITEQEVTTCSDAWDPNDPIADAYAQWSAEGAFVDPASIECGSVFDYDIDIDEPIDITWGDQKRAYVCYESYWIGPWKEVDLHHEVVWGIHWHFTFDPYAQYAARHFELYGMYPCEACVSPSLSDDCEPICKELQKFEGPPIDVIP